MQFHRATMYVENEYWIRCAQLAFEAVVIDEEFIFFQRVQKETIK